MANSRTVKSPLPGIFYRGAGPDADAFVNEGQQVKTGDTIGLVEVMKSFHEVKADGDGVVLRFLIGNEEPVQIGQDIFELGE